jgi:sugar/nucleoside kinase (ribokinase family)
VRVVAPDGTMVFEPWSERQEVLAQVDILKADAVEAEMLTGESDIHTAAKTLAAWGPKEIVLTHRDGLLVLAEGKEHEAPFLPRQLIGRSGRGDTCVASYVAKRLSGSPAEACVWAAALTSLKMEAEGPIKKTMADVEAMIQRSYTM